MSTPHDVYAPADALWAKVLAAFPYVSTLTEATSEVSRILRKWHRDLAPTYVESSTCDIRQEHWPTARLSELTLRPRRGNPDRDYGPIVAVEYHGSKYVVDGTKRTNLWREQQSPDEHEILLIRRPGDQ